MSYILNVEPKHGYLYFRVTGRNSYNNIARYLAEVRDICLQQECPVILIEANLKGRSLDNLSIYNLLAKTSKQTLKLIRKIAYVDINLEHSVAALQFAENVAVNRGLFMRVFATTHEAEAWLAKPENPENMGVHHHATDTVLC